MLQLITILNRCHRFPGFVYHQARFSSDHSSIEIAVRPRKGSEAFVRVVISLPRIRPTPERRFEFIPFWGFLVFLLYSMRRVDCRRCQAVVVEEVPWGDGKRTLTKAYMLFLARWERRLSWKETAEAFRTSWEKFSTRSNMSSPSGWNIGCSADRRHRSRRNPVRQRAQYLTLVYQIDLGVPACSGLGTNERLSPFRDSSPLSATKSLQRSSSSAPICGNPI